MYKKFHGTLFLIALMPLVALGKTYSFSELLNLAEKNSISTEIVKTKILETQSKIDKVRSNYFPKINAIVGGEKIELRSKTQVDSSNFVADLQIDFNLFQFGASSNAIDALNIIKRNQESFLGVSKRNIYRKLKKEHTIGLHLKDLKLLLEEELKFNKKLKKQVNKRYQQGLVGQADILEINMRDATLKQKLLTIEEELDHTKDNIRKMTLIPHDQSVDLEGATPHEHFDAAPKELIAAAKKLNSNYLRSVAEASSLSLQLDSAKFKRLPELNLRGSYGRPKYVDRLSGENTQGVVGIYLEVPIWDGGERSSVTDSYKALLARKTLEMNQTSRNLPIDIMHKYEKMSNIHKQVDLAEVNVKNGKVYFKSVLNEYKKGVKNSIDLVSARDRLMSFMSDLIIAKKDFIVSKLELEEVAGVTFK